MKHFSRSMRVAAILARGGVSGGDGTLTIDPVEAPDLLENLRTRLRAVAEERATAMASLETLHSEAEARGEDSLQGEALDQHRTLVSSIARLDEQIGTLRSDVETLTAGETANAGLDQILNHRREIPGAPATGGAQVRREPRTYDIRGEHSFFADMYDAKIGRRRNASIERLQRHDQEARVDGWHPNPDQETRDVAVSDVGSLVVPQYMVELFAPNLHNGRPMLENVNNSIPLPPEGQTITVPLGSTKTTVAVQAAEGDAVSETDIAVTDLTIPVRTFAGQQDISRQALERGSMLDSIIYSDLTEAYAAATGASAFQDDGTSGTFEGLDNMDGEQVITYTDASPTVAEFLLKFWDGVQQLQTNRKLPPTAVFMHPRRWGWIMAAADSTNRPLVVPIGQAGDNAVGRVESLGYGGVVGFLGGLPVVTDANISTTQGAGTEDAVYIARASDIIFMEEAGGPRQVRFDSPGAGTLEVKLVVFAFSAFTAERYPVSVSRITGTGLIAPTF